MNTVKTTFWQIPDLMISLFINYPRVRVVHVFPQDTYFAKY